MICPHCHPFISEQNGLIAPGNRKVGNNEVSEGGVLPAVSHSAQVFCEIRTEAGSQHQETQDIPKSYIDRTKKRDFSLFIECTGDKKDDKIDNRIYKRTLRIKFLDDIQAKREAVKNA